MPESYFDKATTEELTSFQEKAVSRRSEEWLPELTAILGNKKIENTWQASAAGVYRNWLGHICAQKETVLVSQRLRVMADSEEMVGTPFLPTLAFGDAG
jgi:hypothetical protein